MAKEIGVSKATSLKTIAGGVKDENIQDKVEVNSLYSQYKLVGKDVVSVNTDESFNYINRRR